MLFLFAFSFSDVSSVCLVCGTTTVLGHFKLQDAKEIEYLLRQENLDLHSSQNGPNMSHCGMCCYKTRRVSKLPTENDVANQERS